MKIRKANRGDAAVLADYNVKLAWETERLRLTPAVVAKGVRALLQDASKGIYFVAETPEAGVVGQLLITYEWSDWRNANIWWIQSVYVPKESRGQGVFRALFNHVAGLARKSNGVWSLRLYVETHNEAAQGTYRKLGMNKMAYEVFEFPASKIARAKKARRGGD